MNITGYWTVRYMRFSKTVDIPPCKLGANILKDITEMVKQKYEKSCTKNHGYMYNVGNVRIDSLRTEYTSPNACAHVSFSASTLKPDVGNEFNATVVKSMKQGIMLQVNMFKVFAPEHAPIPDGSNVRVRIEATKYDKNQYNCIGKII